MWLAVVVDEVKLQIPGKFLPVNTTAFISYTNFYLRIRMVSFKFL